MPTASDFANQNLVTLLLSGLAGWGKSCLAMGAPGPIAALLVDKPIVATLPAGTPGYDPKQVFWKSYPPPDIDLADEKAKKPRNVADAILKDITTIKNHLIAVRNWEIVVRAERLAQTTEEKPPVLKMGNEIWPTPRTLLIEGGDFIARHVENRILNIHDKKDMSEWEDRFTGWRMRLSKLHEIYDTLSYLPEAQLCNVVVTTGLDEESKMVKNDKGKMELVKTGKIDPDLGGKMAIEGPRKFANSWLCLADAGKWWVVTKPDGKYTGYRGIRSGQFGLPSIIDVTVDVTKPRNIWRELFGGAA